MKTKEIKELLSRFEAEAAEIEGVECWSARALQELLGYAKWENFEKVIEKAKAACQTAGEKITNHFPDVRKMVLQELEALKAQKKGLIQVLLMGNKRLKIKELCG